MSRVPDVIIGHERQCGQLLHDIAHGNVAHAYLFVGPKHVGKMTISRWFASRLLADGMPPEAYRRVKSDVEKLIHPDFLSLDLLWIEGIQEDWTVIGETSNAPQEHRSKAPMAKTDSISIEDVRALSEKLHGTGASRYSCCVIRSMERMHTAAATALLKLLEEPPPRVVFILTTENLSSLLPTIHSRTRIVHFSRLKDEMLRTLVAHMDDDAEFALHLAEGAPGKLLRLLADTELLRTQKQIHSQAKQFWQSTSVKERLSWLMTYAESKVPTEDVLLHLGLALREHPDLEKRSLWMKPYAKLVEGLQTNAHKGLLLERFVLAIDGIPCYPS